MQGYLGLQTTPGHSFLFRETLSKLVAKKLFTVNNFYTSFTVRLLEFWDVVYFNVSISEKVMTIANMRI